MKIRPFKTPEEMNLRVVSLLATEMQVESAIPRAIMLSGGRTPLPAYRQLSIRALRASSSTWLLFSDERMVPLISPDNNYSTVKPMITAVGVPEERVLRVHTETTLVDAASRYDRELGMFFAKGGQVGLGLLGLGADGHTASIFSMEDAFRGRGHMAIGVSHPGQMDRVTVTPDFLARIDRIVVLVAGEDKTDIVEKLEKSPQSVPAAQALARCRNVEVWVTGLKEKPEAPATPPNLMPPKPPAAT